MDTLNECQQDAVRLCTQPGSSVAIVAAPGSGKTRTLVAAIAEIVGSHFSRGQAILAITFTRQAAMEMRERVEKLVGMSGARLCNFHSLALSLVTEEYTLLGFKKLPVVISKNQQHELMLAAIAGEHVNVKGSIVEDNMGEEEFIDTTFRKSIVMDKRQRDTVLYMENWIKEAKSYFASRRSAEFMKKFDRKVYAVEYRVMERYCKQMDAVSGLDFNDLIPLAIRLLERNPDILLKIHKKYEHIFCDEFQDVSTLQFKFLQLLRSSNASLAVVGDDDQAIYGWRGAIRNSFSVFEKAYPDSKFTALNQTYRSTKHIVNAVSSVIGHNSGRKNKKLWTMNSEGSKLTVFSTDKPSQEVRLISDFIVRFRDSARDFSYSSIAVISRTRKGLQGFHDVFDKLDIPYRNQTVKGKFPNSKEAHDILAYSELLYSTTPSIVNKAFKRVVNLPSRGLGKQVIQELNDISRVQECTFLEAAQKYTYNISAPKQKREKMAEFLKLISQVKKKVIDSGYSSNMYGVFSVIVEMVQYEAYITKVSKNGTSKKNLQNLMTFSKGQQHISIADFLNAFGNGSDSKNAVMSEAVTLTTIHQGNLCILHRRSNLDLYSKRSRMGYRICVSSERWYHPLLSIGDGFRSTLSCGRAKVALCRNVTSKIKAISFV